MTLNIEELKTKILGVKAFNDSMHNTLNYDYRSGVRDALDFVLKELGYEVNKEDMEDIAKNTTDDMDSVHITTYPSDEYKQNPITYNANNEEYTSHNIY